MMGLFQLGDFTLRSGAKSAWKIECDVLTPDDWAALAKMAAEILPPFGFVYGVPRGGVPFAHALQEYASDYCLDPVLIAEDVVTTGGSMERYRAEHDPGIATRVIGVCVFARGPCPEWVTPLFRMPTPAGSR